MKHLIIFLITLTLSALACGGEEAATGAPDAAANEAAPAELDSAPDKWAAVRAADVAQVPDGWTTPERVATSDGNWEDSPSISPDGETLLFMYYAAEDLLSAWILGTDEFIEDDIDVYRSEKPFITKEADTRYYLSEDYGSAAGPMIADNGDVFYHSNHQGIETGKPDDDIYRNDELLPFNTDEYFNNPHYCTATDELWMDQFDTQIFILKNAAANGFDGQPELAPAPINLDIPDVQNLQPWLSTDCQRIYFSSSRHNPGGGPYIYRAERLGENEWSEPEVVISSKLAVGEPTLTADEKELYFLQVFQNEDGKFTSDIFVTRRE